jgi:beta-lactamase superfamily II metal-dependent hydrolase
LVVVTGCLSLVFGAAWPLLAEVFNHANRVFITGLLALVDYIRGIPGGSFFVCAPSIAVVAGWYGLLLAVFLSPTGKRTRIILPACALLAALYFAGLTAVPFIDVMDVGLGQAAVLRIPGGGHVLVDAGPAYREEAVLRHLRRLGINRLHALVLSHPDARHVGAASAVLDAFTVDELWCSPHRGRSGLYRRVLEQAADKGVRIRRLECGSHGVLEEGIVWKVFHPSGTVRYRKGDDASLVIRFAREGWGVLLGGGANRYVEQSIVSNGIPYAAPVWVVGNNGERGVATTNWLAGLHATDAIISVGHPAARELPAPDVLARLRDAGLRVWRTDRDGTIRIQWQPARPLDGVPGYAVSVESDE